MTKQFKLTQFSEPIKIKKLKKDTVKVIFLKQVPQFMGIDMKKYGSYNIGDIAEIPIMNSNGLIKKGGCRYVS